MSNGVLKFFGRSVPEPQAARRGLEATHDRIAGLVDLLDARDDLGVQVHQPRVQRVVDLLDRGEGHALAGLPLAHDREVVEAEDHVLRRHDDRLAVGGD